MKFIEVIEGDKLSCTLEYIRELSDFWPRSIGISAKQELLHSGCVFFILKDGGVTLSDKRPVGTELVLTFKRMDWAVDSVQEINRATTEFNGKHYYTDELNEALAGCEVK